MQDLSLDALDEMFVNENYNALERLLPPDGSGLKRRFYSVAFPGGEWATLLGAAIYHEDARMVLYIVKTFGTDVLLDHVSESDTSAIAGLDRMMYDTMGDYMPKTLRRAEVMIESVLELCDDDMLEEFFTKSKRARYLAEHYYRASYVQR
jgi:hypothetical protein